MIDPHVPSAPRTANRPAPRPASGTRPLHGSLLRRLAVLVAAPLLVLSAGENPPPAASPAPPAAGSAVTQVNLAFTVNNMGYTDTCG